MKRRIEDSKIEQIYMVRPGHLNGADRLFGGQLMSWIDEVAGMVALRHAQCDVVTAAVDNLRFIRGAKQKDILVLIGRLTYVGNSSMEVRVDTYVESTDGMRRPINRAYLTEVALDAEGHPVRVPGIVIETESERAEWEAGQKRQEMRKRRYKEGF